MTRQEENHPKRQKVDSHRGRRVGASSDEGGICAEIDSVVGDNDSGGPSDSDLNFFSDADSEPYYRCHENQKTWQPEPDSSSTQSMSMSDGDLSAMPLQNALEKLVPRLRYPDTLLQAATILLDRIRDGLEDESGTKLILRAIALHAEPHPAVTEQVVQLVYFCDCPAVIVDVISQISGASEPEVNLIVEQFKELLKGDRELLVPILGSLADLTLPESLCMETFHLATAALSIVDEGDLPAVVRTLLRVTPIRTTERIQW